MSSKINTLLDKLNLSNNCKKCFIDANLVKIIGNKEKTNYMFYIEIPETLSIEYYKEFIEKLRESFNTIESVNVVFKVSNINNAFFIDYVKESLLELSKKSAMLKMFINNKIEYDNELKIYVDNVAELKKIEEYKLNIEEFLDRVGYPNTKLNILVDEEES